MTEVNIIHVEPIYSYQDDCMKDQLVELVKRVKEFLEGEEEVIIVD